jgi:hypothetical protein
MNFIYNRLNAGLYPLDETSLVWEYHGFELHKEVTYRPDDIIRLWYVVNPDGGVAILQGYEYDDVTESQFMELLYERDETLSL